MLNISNDNINSKNTYVKTSVKSFKAVEIEIRKRYNRATTMKRYEPAKIEAKWQKRWADEKLYASKLSKDHDKKMYVLAEFPYPSGDLHMGHWFTFGGADIYARLKRMQGYEVFFPNGFDAFGLPAENAAIKRNIHPQDWTMSNIAKMKEQFLTMGASFSFDHEVITCLPNYYKWNQWIFLKMLEKGIAYRGSYLSNWCPNCQTVLANEGVESGKCWRCGTEVVQKEVEQWFFRITEYADRLKWPENPKADWPKSVRDAQNDWIGRKEGIELTYRIEGTDESVTVFTTRPDTNFGATFIALAPEQPLVSKITTEEQKKEVEAYVQAAAKKSELERKENKEKTGAFTGRYAINPLNNEKMPIWVSDFVLAGFGTGALVGVPAYDEKDMEFVKKFDLEVRQVELEDMEKIMDRMEAEGWGKRVVQYHLHDWSISRQRYWGTPIPVIHCPKCGMVPVPDADLPIVLPYDVDYAPKGKSPLASNEEWMKVKCPKCQGEAQRDPDTMDTFVDSSWYFFRYLDPQLDSAPFDEQVARTMMPVDIYFGGAEHTLGHTLYARFFTRFFKDLGLTDLEEFAARRIGHGVVLGPDGNRMSKSRGNVVNPDEEVKKFGADACRLYLAFFMPYDAVGSWVSERIWGTYRFVERVWNLYDKVGEAEMSAEDLKMMHHTINRVTEDIEAIKFNTAVARMMEWLNHLSAKPQVSREEYETLLKLVAPFAPHFTEELWQELANEGSIHQQSWPQFESSHLVSDEVKVAVQVNGKVRDTIVMRSDAIDDSKVAEKLALESAKVQKFVAQQPVKRVVYIPGKILSIVTEKAGSE